MERKTLEEAGELIRRHTRPLSACKMPLTEINGEILYEDIRAIHDQPPFPRSPLDGYALRGEDTKGASKECPVVLQVIDKFCAGEYREIALQPGECIRIMTGAPIPAGANAVIRQEDTDYGEKEVSIYASVSPWENYCYQGEDYKSGDLLLKKQTELNFSAAAVLASNGITEVMVYPKPKIAIFSTGDELLEPGMPLQPGKIYNSNLYMLCARLREWGIFAQAFQVSDEKETVKQKIIESLKWADAVITTGGVSVGEKDILNEILHEPQMELIFDGVEIKPGSPVKYALYQGKPILALSGNPFAALVTFELFGKAMLQALMGKTTDGAIPKTKAMLENQFSKGSKVRRLIRGVYENGSVKVPEGHSSGQLSSMLGCNCLVDIPKGSPALPAGALVEVILL